MRVLVYDDRPRGTADEVAADLRRRLPLADVVVQTRREIRLIEEPAVAVVVLPLDALQAEPQPDALALLVGQHPEALVLVTVTGRPRADLLRLALSRGVRGFAVNESPAALAVLVAMLAADRDTQPEHPTRDARSQP